MIHIYCGYDSREAAVYHAFTQSLIENSTIPVAVTPLHGPMLDGFDGQKDGTNRFIYSRFLVPHLQQGGWGIYADSDMICLGDIRELWDLRDETKAVQVVKHDYSTHSKRKFRDTPLESGNEDYPRKNWSSLILWNCNHSSNWALTPEFVTSKPGSYLHRFAWLEDEEIGELPKEWNHLSGEVPPNQHAKLIHYTLGAPAFEHYRKCDRSREWHETYLSAIHMAGEDPVKMTDRSVSAI